MTFALAMATRDYGLMAADCRTRFREFDATQDTIVPLSTRYVENTNKLCPLRGGWLVGGPHATWKQRLYERIRDVPAADVVGIRAAARAVADEQMAALEREQWSTLAAEIRARLLYFVVGPSAEAFTCTAMNWTGADLWPGGVVQGQAIALGPHEWTPDELNSELVLFQRRLSSSGSGGPLLDVIRETAALFQRVCVRADPTTGSVNQRVTIGTLRRTASRIVQEVVGPIESWELAGSPDPELAAYVTEVADAAR